MCILVWVLGMRVMDARVFGGWKRKEGVGSHRRVTWLENFTSNGLPGPDQTYFFFSLAVVTPKNEE